MYKPQIKGNRLLIFHKKGRKSGELRNFQLYIFLLTKKDVLL